MNFDLSSLVSKSVFSKRDLLRIQIVQTVMARQPQAGAAGAAGAGTAPGSRRTVRSPSPAPLSWREDLTRLRVPVDPQAKARGQGYRSPDSQCLAVTHHRHRPATGADVTETWGVPLCGECNHWLQQSVKFKGPGDLRDARTAELCSLVL